MNTKSLLALILCCQAPLSAEPVDFVKQVAPIFAQHCVRCHYPGNAEGDISLATPNHLRENQLLDPDGSHLVSLITSQDGEAAEMPAEGPPLEEAQVEVIKAWVAEGAPWPDGFIVEATSKANESWWSLQPIPDALRDEALDAAAEADRLDGFIDARLSEAGLARNPAADRATLIRRLTYDLLGLPPTAKEVEAFVADDDPRAYEKLVERLLDSPHYGERWARHWLDVVRFGESIGFERNVIVNDLWPFRDYVIRSINRDRPFDEMIREHLAGDVINANDPDVAIGSAFLVAGPYDDVGNQDAVQAAQIRANTLDEIIGATGQAFLGLTLGCARCHDHKFDPIRQSDYYSWYATFAGVRHGSVPLGTPQQVAARRDALTPLETQRDQWTAQLATLKDAVLQRAKPKLDTYREAWSRPPIDRRGTEERFTATKAKYVRLVCQARDDAPQARSGFRVDEFEVYATQDPAADVEPQNVALASNGSKATGKARHIEDFPGAYSPMLAIDGKTGARFIAASDRLTIELPAVIAIDRVVFSSAKGSTKPQQGKFTFVGEYQIEVSVDGETWTEVAHGRDRQPASDALLDARLEQLAITEAERQQRRELRQRLAKVKQEIAQLPAVPKAWIGTRSAEDARGPFHVFLGGSPQKKGKPVSASSMSVFMQPALKMHFRQEATADGGLPDFYYSLPSAADEATRRLHLAKWITHRHNPLTPRVLANRVWHYHFGTGIVDTPSDFGYMGGRPTHPELLDFLAARLQAHNWRLKPLHRMIVLSQTYRQATTSKPDAARLDADARWLWRFPPRRLSAEEIRDTVLLVSGAIKRLPDDAPEEVPDGGPGFRLYHFMQDNVCTYAPLDTHGPATYRRAIYHQNARASVVDLMTDFDQPDCAFSAPKRAETTTPLQALTMLNHQFTLDMAKRLAAQAQAAADNDIDAQVAWLYRHCYARAATDGERNDATKFIAQYDLVAYCRVLLNTSELLYVR